MKLKSLINKGVETVSVLYPEREAKEMVFAYMEDVFGIMRHKHVLEPDYALSEAEVLRAEEDFEKISGLDAQAAVILAGMAAKPLGLIDILIHQQSHLMLLVVHQTQHAGGAGGAAQQALHILRRGKGETGGADLCA